MTGDIPRLITLLSDSCTLTAEDAKAELISAGRAAVPALAEAVPSMGRFGQLSAIEVFQALGDDTAGPALIDLLGSDSEEVRQWSAAAIAALGVRDAVPALTEAYRRHRDADGALDDLEVVTIRRALSDLGARRAVLPPLTASLSAPLRTQAVGIDRAWPFARLVDVINDLADHDQAVLYFSLWSVIDGQAYWRGHRHQGRSPDVDRPWSQVVESARETKLREVASVSPEPSLKATVEWIDRADL